MSFAGAIGLAHQVGYWQEFSVNLFSYSSPGDLVALAVSPLVSSALLLFPTVVTTVNLVVLLIFIMSARRLFQRAKSNDYSIPRKEASRTFGLLALFLVNTVAIYFLFRDFDILSATQIGLPHGAPQVEVREYINSLINIGLVPAGLVALNFVVIANSDFLIERIMPKIGVPVIVGIASLFVVTFYGAGRLEGLSRKSLGSGSSYSYRSILFIPVVAIRTEYGKGACLTLDSAKKITDVEPMIEKFGPGGGKFKHVGRLGETEFFYSPYTQSVHVTDTDTLGGYEIVSCQNSSLLSTIKIDLQSEEREKN